MRRMCLVPLLLGCFFFVGCDDLTPAEMEQVKQQAVQWQWRFHWQGHWWLSDQDRVVAGAEGRAKQNDRDG